MSLSCPWSTLRDALSTRRSLAMTISHQAALCFLLLAVAQAPDTPPKPGDKEALSGNAAKAAEFARAEGVRYDVRYADNGKQPFALLSKPVLRWSNPTNGEVHGSVVLWTRD